jgi:hypothetical protein
VRARGVVTRHGDGSKLSVTLLALG